MPIYQYECSQCGWQEEVSHSIKQEFLTECTSCHSNTFSVIITDAPLAFVKEITTVGQFAENNTKKLGKYKIQEIEESKEVAKEVKNQNFAEKIDKMVDQGKLPRGTRVRKYERQKKDDKLEKLMKMTPEKTKKYIETGDM